MSSIGSKRSLTPPNSTTAKKRSKIDFDFDSKFIASSQDDLDIGLLRVQNRRLAERLHQRQRIEADLCARIEQMEKKQLNDDTKLYVINRYWNQLNEDMRLILQRFDDQTNEDNSENESDGSGSESNNENEETTSFMRQLTNCDKEELDEALQQRVMLSTRAVSKVLQAFDRIVQRQEKITSALKNCNVDDDDEDDDDIKSPDHDGEKSTKSNKTKTVINLDNTVKELNQQLTKENKNLNCLVTSLHEKNRTLSLKYTQLNDKMESNDLQLDDLKNRIDELEFELNKSRTREQRLEGHLYETREKLSVLQNSTSTSEATSGDNSKSGNGDDGLSSAKIDDLKRELEEQRELAISRLQELDQLNNSHKDTLKLVEKYKLDLQCLPDSVIQESAEYKSLQSHFSVLFNESMQLKTQLEETRTQLTNAKNTHLRQIEHMESEELSMQKRLRNECIQLEDSLSQVRKEYEMLRLEFEQTLAANEQTGPINREMRHLISSLQNHTQQLKGENARIKKKLKEYSKEIARFREIIEKNGLNICYGGVLLPDHKTESVDGGNSDLTDTKAINSSNNNIHSKQTSIESFPNLSSDSSNDAIIHSAITKMEDNSMSDDIHKTKLELKQESDTTPPLTSPLTSIKKESPHSMSDSIDPLEPFTNFDDLVGSAGSRKIEESKELKMHLKKSLEAQRELKLLLDMFKSVDKEKREKAQLMANEKKYKIEIEELKAQIKKLHEAASRGDRRRITDEDYYRKVSKYEEAIAQLQKNVAAHKQEEEALLNEMEVTGQAFEDMQEQNIRLLQQLREKDDANFKLMSERIKSNQIHKLLKEEKDLLTEQVITLQSQVDAQIQVVRKLEEKERILQNNLVTIEKELAVRQQAMDFHKRKAMESSQAASDLKLHLDKYVAQIRDAQSIVADKTSAWQQEMFKTKRLHEEVQSYKRKYERAKKFELATTADEVLQEEIRELKEELTCPSCKTKRKDAVLNKCFHVFCYDCLKTRYETRQRKCPKCNQSFSANDFHRLYLA